MAVQQTRLLLQKNKMRGTQHRLVAVQHRPVERHARIQCLVHPVHVRRSILFGNWTPKSPRQKSPQQPRRILLRSGRHRKPRIRFALLRRQTGDLGQRRSRQLVKQHTVCGTGPVIQSPILAERPFNLQPAQKKHRSLPFPLLLKPRHENVAMNQRRSKQVEELAPIAVQFDTHRPRHAFRHIHPKTRPRCVRLHPGTRLHPYRNRKRLPAISTRCRGERNPVSARTRRLGTMDRRVREEKTGGYSHRIPLQPTAKPRKFVWPRVEQGDSIPVRVNNSPPQHSQLQGSFRRILVGRKVRTRKSEPRPHLVKARGHRILRKHRPQLGADMQKVVHRRLILQPGQASHRTTPLPRLPLLKGLMQPPPKLVHKCLPSLA